MVIKFHSYRTVKLKSFIPKRFETIYFQAQKFWFRVLWSCEVSRLSLSYCASFFIVINPAIDAALGLDDSRSTKFDGDDSNIMYSKWVLHVFSNTKTVYLSALKIVIMKIDRVSHGKNISQKHVLRCVARFSIICTI